VSTPERREATDAVTWPVRVAAAWTWRILLLGFGVYVLARIFVRLELVAFSFVVALFLTAVLHPLELALRRMPGPRSVSSAFALLIGLAILAGVGYFVSWQISTHATELGDQLTRFVHETRNWLRNGPLHLNSADLDRIANNITNSIKHNQGQLISGAIQTVRTVAEAFGALLLILLSTFFLLRDGDGIWAWVLRLFPRQAQDRMDIAGRAGWHTFGGYMRGQVLIALFHGVSVTVLLFVLRVPLAAALGVLIFLGSFIPLVGLTVTGALCVAVAGLEHGLTSAVVVAIAIIVLVQLEAHLLQPLIMSRSVEVHPLAIALSVVTGTLLAGIVGALLAVPLVAFLNSTISALRHGSASLVIADTVPRRRLRRRDDGIPPEQPGTATDEVPSAGDDGARIELPSEVARRSDSTDSADGSPDV
jgi:predicted PurR-regulated permease PerM